MPDRLSPEDRRRTMKAVKGSGTSLERKLWSMLAGLGLKGWTRNAPELPGRPDAAFYAEQVAVFVDGCFWHHCPHCNRPLPQNNAEYWERKILRNEARDREVTETLEAQNWRVIRIWEHEMRSQTLRQTAASKIVAALDSG